MLEVGSNVQFNWNNMNRGDVYRLKQIYGGDDIIVTISGFFTNVFNERLFEIKGFVGGFSEQELIKC